MLKLMNISTWSGCLAEYKDAEDFDQSLRRYGLDGIEMIHVGEDVDHILPPERIIGLHMSFFPYWIDLWDGNREALLAEFGSEEAIRSFYGGADKTALISQFRTDLERAHSLGVRYVVFHVSNTSIEEVYSYRMRHTDLEIIDASAELINLLLDGKGERYQFDFLMENLWFPGLTMTDPSMTERLLAKVHYPRKGILLDTGHLLNTNPNLATEEEALAYIHRKLDLHGILTKYIKGIHLHQSLSGSYVRQFIGREPVLPADYFERLAQVYEHLGSIDTHMPMTAKGTKALIDRIGPEYLIFEHNPGTRALREQYLQQQIETISF